MFKKKPLFLTFEGVEGSGKSYQSNRLYKNVKKSYKTELNDVKKSIKFIKNLYAKK